MSKLKYYGIHGNLLNWIKSYLFNRTQRVTVQGYKSFSYFSTSGVPQGSHLGPILFLIFINDISNHIKYSQCSVFADDLKLYKIINTQEDVEALQTDLDSVIHWCSTNKMNINASKCLYIKFTKKRNVNPSSYAVDNQTLNTAPSVRDLGVILDKKLNFIEHIDNITTRAWKVSGMVKRTCKDFKSPASILTLYKALIRSVLEYASPIWNPYYNIHINRIERVQRSFTRFLAYKDPNCPYRADYHTRLLHFNLSSLEMRRKICDLKTLHKILHGQVCCSNVVQRININVPRSIPRHPNYKIFFPSCTGTNVGKYAPLNRLMGTYNELLLRGDIDIFFSIDCKEFVKNCLEVYNSLN